MRFGVLACPACRRIQAAELRFGRVACRSCQKAIDLATARLFYKGDDEEDARRVVQRVSAQVGGVGIEEFAGLLESLERDRPPGSVEQVLEALASAGEFDADTFAEAMKHRRVPGDPANVLATLAAQNRVYEPRLGRFRVVRDG